MERRREVDLTSIEKVRVVSLLAVDQLLNGVRALRLPTIRTATLTSYTVDRRARSTHLLLLQKFCRSVYDGSTLNLDE